MGFYQQPNDWTCGPFALKHALYGLGKFVSEGEIAKLAKTHWWAGTNEVGLARAARRLGVELGLERKYDEASAKRALVRSLARSPVLLCVDDWAHWICALKHVRGEFVIVDSNLDPVLDVVSWRQLARRWRYDDVEYSEDAPPTLYDLMPVVAVGRTKLRADFSPARIRHLRRARNHDLARSWDAYVADLVAICRPRSTTMSQPVSMAEFLRRNGKPIASRLAYWHGDVDDAAIRQQLDHFQFVAETYGLVVRRGDTKRALIDLTTLLTLWVSARNPVEPFYDGS